MGTSSSSSEAKGGVPCYYGLLKYISFPKFRRCSCGFLVYFSPARQIAEIFLRNTGEFQTRPPPRPPHRPETGRRIPTSTRGPGKKTPDPGTLKLSPKAHARVDKARRDERHQNRCPRRRNPSRRALAPCSGLRPSGVVSGARPHPACLPAARRCAPEFQKNTRSFSALPSALS